MQNGIVIARIAELEAQQGPLPWLDQEMAGICQRATTRWPNENAAQQRFLKLWLGDYLAHDRDLAFVALAEKPHTNQSRVVGYLVASLADQATDARFATLTYLLELAPHYAAFPAHLHINIDNEFRNLGLGQQLITALNTELAARGVPGVHIVTARMQKNVRFYARAGFEIVGSSLWNGIDLIMMGRRI